MPKIPTTNYEKRHCAAIIRINDRYFCGFSKVRHVMTSWSIFGARMFGIGSTELAGVVADLAAKGKNFEVMRLEPL